MSSSSRAASLIKPYVRKLVLQTHPDFFQRDPAKAKQNAASLQQLYTILNPILKERHPADTPADAAMHVAFFPKHAPQSAHRVGITFDPQPASVWHTAASVLDLCRQLDIKVAASDEDAVRQMIAKASSSTQHRPSFKSLRDEFARALYQQHRHQQPQQQQTQWTAGDVLGNRHLVFAPSVDKQVVAARLARWLSELHPERWWGQIPVLVLPPATSLSPERAKGILVLTSDMELEEMKRYLQDQVDIKKREYQTMGKGGPSP